MDHWTALSFWEMVSKEAHVCYWSNVNVYVTETILAVIWPL